MGQLRKKFLESKTKRTGLGDLGILIDNRCAEEIEINLRMFKSRRIKRILKSKEIYRSPARTMSKKKQLNI